MSTITPITPIAPITPSKNVEVYLGEYVLRLLYAACADVEIELDTTDKFSPYTFHSYESMCVEKKNRNKLDARFAIADEAKQMLAFIFNKCIDECLSVTIDADDTAETVLEKISEVTDDSFFALANNFAASQSIGEVLTGACDPGCGLRGFVVGKMPTYVAKDRVLSMVFTSIDGFLKALSVAVMKLWWFQRKPIDGGMLAGLLFARGLNQYMVADLVACLREKPVAKPKAATKPRAKKNADVITDAPLGVSTDTTTTVTFAENVADQTSVPVVDPSVLDAILGVV